MDLALDVEAQLREAIPLAVQCNVCKPRRGEILNMLSNAMADAVDLLQQLCNVELFGSGDTPSPQHRPMMKSIEWFQPSPNGWGTSSVSQQMVPHGRSFPSSFVPAGKQANGGKSPRRATHGGVY